MQILAQDPEADATRTVSTINRQTIHYTKRLPAVDEVELIRIGRIGELGDIGSYRANQIYRGPSGALDCLRLALTDVGPEVFCEVP